MLESLSRSLAVRAIRSWGGLRGDVRAMISTDVQPVIVMGTTGAPDFESWSFSRSKAAVVGQNALVGIYNKDPRPEDPGGAQGGAGSMVIIDHICFSTGGAADVICGIVDSTNVLNPNSSASMLAIWQPIKNPPYKVTGVGFGDNSIVGVIGDQTIPHAGLAAGVPHDLDVNIYLGPGHAFVMQPTIANTQLNVWARGRYYSAP